MKELFVITITTKEDHPIEGRSFFTENGDCIGRVLNVRKNTIRPNDPFCSYDVETSEEVYKKLVDGAVKLYGMDDYTVSKCNTSYIVK